MKAVRAVLDYFSKGGMKYIFGIPAGSVNAFFDELYTIPHITPIISKHECTAAYMAAAYAKYTNGLGICIGCSGPGSSNLLTGAANAKREQLPVLFLTGAVPTRTVGLNASQELNSEPLFRHITKYSVTVGKAEDLLGEVVKAVEIALSGIPGPVHVAMPIDIQLCQIPEPFIPEFPLRLPVTPDYSAVLMAAKELSRCNGGYIFVGQGARLAVEEVIEAAEILNWEIVTTPQAKGLVPSTHPLMKGIYGFAGHESASSLINEGDGKGILIIGSSLGETATNNWNPHLAKNRFVVQIDHDESVFNRVYDVNVPIHGDTKLTLKLLVFELKQLARATESLAPSTTAADESLTALTYVRDCDTVGYNTAEYNTQNVLLSLQAYLPSSTRYVIDIGEFMAYVIQYMEVMESHTYDINVHFGAMGSAIGSAIGMKLASPLETVVCITGDGCFFMHGMEILTAKEYNIPILFIVMNNARLGMVYHGHNLQYKRSHPCFEQKPVNIAEMARVMGIPSMRVERMEDVTQEGLAGLAVNGPAILEIALVDNNPPPMGDRVKFLSSFTT